jgi:hypothetical protein
VTHTSSVGSERLRGLLSAQIGVDGILDALVVAVEVQQLVANLVVAPHVEGVTLALSH